MYLNWKKCQYLKKQHKRTYKVRCRKAVVLHSFLQIMFSCRKSKSMMSYHLLKIGRKTSSLLATRSCLVIIIILFLSYKFCAGDFSEMALSISFKFTGIMPRHVKFIPPRQFFKIHFLSEVIVSLRFLKVNFVCDVSQKRVKILELNFQR